VSLVAGTQIFARSRATGRQILVYSMTINADADLTMILPLPRRSGVDEFDVNFIEMSSYQDFFDDIAKAVTIGHSTCRSPRSSQDALPKPTLVVRNVGSFEASFAPTRADLNRLDSRFKLKPNFWRPLPAYKGFGFAVFKLRSGLKRIHPMAQEFPCREPDALFFPTVHVHDGGSVPAVPDFEDKLFFLSAKGPWLREWFASGAPAKNIMRVPSLPSNLVNLEQECYLVEVHGQRANRDVYLIEARHGLVTKGE
jgi:hypothetical protein